MSNLQVLATLNGSHLIREPTWSPVLTKCWNLELILTTNFGNLHKRTPNLVAKILATKFGFVPDCVKAEYTSINYSDTETSLTHWDRVTPTCIVKLTIIGPDNGLSPGQRQTIIWTNAGLLLIGPSGTNFSGILINSYIFLQEIASKNVIWKMAAILSLPQCADSLAIGMWYKI